MLSNKILVDFKIFYALLVATTVHDGWIIIINTYTCPPLNCTPYLNEKKPKKKKKIQINLCIWTVNDITTGITRVYMLVKVGIQYSCHFNAIFSSSRQREHRRKFWIWWTELCTSTFSYLLLTKSKHRSCLINIHTENSLGLSMSSRTPGVKWSSQKQVYKHFII